MGVGGKSRHCRVAWAAPAARRAPHDHRKHRRARSRNAHSNDRMSFGFDRGAMPINFAEKGWPQIGAIEKRLDLSLSRIRRFARIINEWNASYLRFLVK